MVDLFCEVYIEPANNEYGWFNGCRWLLIERPLHRVTGFKTIDEAKGAARREWGVTHWSRNRTTRGLDPYRIVRSSLIGGEIDGH